MDEFCNTRMDMVEVLKRLEADGCQAYATLGLDDDYNQIVGRESSDHEWSTWFLVEDGVVMVDDDFAELFPL